MAKFEKKNVFQRRKIRFYHCASVIQEQVPKLGTDLDLSLLYILILGTYSKFARKINFLALGVYCPAGQSAFRRSRPQLKLGEEFESSRLSTTIRAELPGTQPHLEALLKFGFKPFQTIFQNTSTLFFAAKTVN